MLDNFLSVVSGRCFHHYSFSRRDCGTIGRQAMFTADSHAPHAWLQGLPFSRRHTGWDRDRTHDPKGPTRGQRAHRIQAICGARSLSVSTDWPSSNRQESLRQNPMTRSAPKTKGPSCSPFNVAPPDMDGGLAVKLYRSVNIGTTVRGDP